MGMPCSSALSGPCCDEQHNPGTSTLPGRLQCSCASCIIGLKQINLTKKGERTTDMQIHVINHSPNLFCSLEIILEVASQVLFANPLLIWEADAATVGCITASSRNPHQISLLNAHDFCNQLFLNLLGISENRTS